MSFARSRFLIWRQGLLVLTSLATSQYALAQQEAQSGRVIEEVYVSATKREGKQSVRVLASDGLYIPHKVRS